MPARDLRSDDGSHDAVSINNGKFPGDLFASFEGGSADLE